MGKDGGGHREDNPRKGPVRLNADKEALNMAIYKAL